jgi:hypothetical protein
VFGGNSDSIEQLEKSFSNCELPRPIVPQVVKNPEEQLSYVLKFGTYHRPFGQSGPQKGMAVPLNPPEHCALLWWMAQRRFQDFMFLFNARREGDKILSGPRSRLSF